MEDIISVILLFGIPIAAIICSAVIKHQRRNLLHLERMKMIENGLVTGADDLKKVEETPGITSGISIVNLMFYLLIAFQVLLFIGGMFYSILFALLFRSPEQSGLANYSILCAMLITMALTVMVRYLTRLRAFIKILYISIFFITLIWINLFIHQISKFPNHISADSLVRKFGKISEDQRDKSKNDNSQDHDSGRHELNSDSEGVIVR